MTSHARRSLIVRWGMGMVMLGISLGVHGADLLLVGDFDKVSPDTFSYKDEKGSVCSASLAYPDPDRGNTGGIRYDIQPEGWGGWGASLKGADVSGYRYLAMDLRGEKGGEVFEIGLRDLKGQEKRKSMAVFVDITTKWQRVYIPLAEFGGVNLAGLENLSLGFTPGMKGRIYFDNIAFEGVADAPGGSIANKAQVDGFDRPNPETAYRVFAGDKSEIKLVSSRVAQDGDYSMEVQYQLLTDNPWGTWVSMLRVPARPFDWSGVAAFKLWVKGDGSDNGLRFRFTEPDGQVWEYFDRKVLSNTRWVQVVMPIESFKLVGQPPRGTPPKLTGVKSYEIAVVSPAAASKESGGRTSAGRIWLDLLTVTGDKIQSAGATSAAPGQPAATGAVAGIPTNVDFSLISYTEYFHSPERQSEVNTNVKLIASGKLGSFSSRVELGTESSEYGDSSAFIGSTVTSTENRFADVKNISYQVFAANVLPSLSLITLGNQFIDYGSDVMAPVWGFRGVSAQGDWKGINYDGFVLKHAQNSFTAGLRGTYYLPDALSDWQLKYSGVYWEQTGKQSSASEVVVDHDELRPTADTSTVTLDRLAHDSVYNVTAQGRLLNDRLRIETTYGYNSFVRYATGDFTDPFDPIFSEPVLPAYRAGGRLWRHHLRTNNLVVQGLEVWYGYRDIEEGYKPHYRQNPVYYDDTDSDQWGHNGKIIQHWRGWTASAEYDHQKRHSNHDYYRHRAIGGVGYTGYKGLDVNLTHQIQREVYFYSSDRSNYNANRNDRVTSTELYVRAQFSPRLAGWVKPKQERMWQPEQNKNLTADSLHARLEFYIANNAKLFAEHKVSRFDNVANEPQGVPFDDNFTRVSFEVTF